MYTLSCRIPGMVHECDKWKVPTSRIIDVDTTKM